MKQVRFVFWVSVLAVCSQIAAAYDPPERIMIERPTFAEQTQRQLRYMPDGGDFVIRNGTEVFNRPLYGGNTAFRTDAGDRPEFSFYFGRHGGVVRFGVKTAEGVKWLHQADNIEARYRAGSMVYRISDPVLKDGEIELTVIGLYDREGMVAKAKLSKRADVELVVAYGGIGGRKGKRSGDIGCESRPVSEFFQLKPEYCKDNVISIVDSRTFTVESKFANFTGIISQDTDFIKADSNHWNDLDNLLTPSEMQIELPVAVGITELKGDSCVYFALLKHAGLESPAGIESVEDMFDSAEKSRKEIAERVSVTTPDEYLDAAASALCVAADAIWDPKDAVMHGAVAWRSKYLGWRGPYANDALGWHDRADYHLKYWARQQDTSPVPDSILPADPKANLARNEPSLHSNGALSHKHYDMNLVYIDALIRHILWTGDMQFAERMWPVIERHMAWERRLFRRSFGWNELPLYEAYAAIWASDDLQYNGGGVTHSSAYNYYHNLMVARIAERLGKDSSPYRQEADSIQKAMRKYLWVKDGWYGEWKDLLGEQSLHPAAALWTFYHTVDSEAVNPVEAWQMSRFVDTQIAHIPVYGGDIPKGEYYTLPTTSWMPYTWSTNNVVMAEVAHTALAYYQAGRRDKAYSLFKGCILDSMFMGKCPGNAGMTTYFDMARGEAQRDFGDAVGTCSRTLVEGLFGIRPDMLSDTVVIKPGFPDDWKYASIDHPDISFSFKQDQLTQEYSIEQRFSKPLSLSLEVKAIASEISSITCNDKGLKWQAIENSVGAPYVRIDCGKAKSYEIMITYKGSVFCDAEPPEIVPTGSMLNIDFKDACLIQAFDPQEALTSVKEKINSFESIVGDNPGHKTVFAELKQGSMRWFEPIDFEIRKPFEIVASQKQIPDAITFQVRNNTANDIDGIATFAVGDHSQTKSLKINPFETSEQIVLSGDQFRLLAGSNRVYVQFNDGRSFGGVVTNWHIASAKAAGRSESVDLDTCFNDSVTDIFMNEYLSPRSPYCSLAIPKQGIGSWCDFARKFEVSDTGLRDAAKNNNGLFQLCEGVEFKIPVLPDTNNIAFTSQWDNYPDSQVIGLSGKARHIYLLMAGSTNSMQSQFDNGYVTVTYDDGSKETLALRNPSTWWPIDQDYYIDDFGFARPEPIPPRVDLKTGKVRILDLPDFRGKGKTVDGGAATVLDLPLDPGKELVSLRLETTANEVVIGLMAATLIR